MVWECRQRFGTDVRSASNFVHLYAPIATVWRVYDNSAGMPKLVARRNLGALPIISRPQTYSTFLVVANAQTQNQGEHDSSGDSPG